MQHGAGPPHQLFLVLPMLFGLFAVADTMVLALLGENGWSAFPTCGSCAWLLWLIHITNPGHQRGGAQRRVPEAGGDPRRSWGFWAWWWESATAPLFWCPSRRRWISSAPLSTPGPTRSFRLYRQPVEGYHAVLAALSLVMCALVYGLQFAFAARRAVDEADSPDSGRSGNLWGMVTYKLHLH